MSTALRFTLANPSASTQLPIAFGYRFLTGERVRGVGFFGTVPTQLTCESNTTCVAPTSIVNSTLPTTASYLGAFGGDLVYQVASTSNPLVGNIFACPTATWGATACVPSALATNVTLPSSPVQSDGRSLYYVASGDVVRLGL
jgi:hypothetical protein